MLEVYLVTRFLCYCRNGKWSVKKAKGDGATVKDEEASHSRYIHGGITYIVMNVYIYSS